jgi:hypothetical protein
VLTESHRAGDNLLGGFPYFDTFVAIKHDILAKAARRIHANGALLRSCAFNGPIPDLEFDACSSSI